MMQLTDTDFSYVFKSLMRKSVDKIMAKGSRLWAQVMCTRWVIATKT